MDTNPSGIDSEARRKMTGAIEHVRHELSGVRTGRASVGILDSVQVGNDLIETG